MSNVFLKRGSIYTITEGNFLTSPVLDDGIYQTMQNPMTGEIFLHRIADKFNFSFKLYGLDNKLISHVLNTYNKQENKHNLGVLLNGAKGTGKTVTAKYLANKLGLPVIICDRPYGGLANFLASIDHDCVFFFDEFEKNFRLQCGNDEDCAGEDLLSIMDGVYSGDLCHVFLLTTNELKVNDNLISRPSRIRYLKSFGEVIDHKVLDEYIDDNLIKKEYKQEIIDFIDSLTMVTIDIVKSIVDEVNLHDCHVEDFKDFFNVKQATYRYYVRAWWVNILDGMPEDGVDKEKFLKCAKLGYISRDELNSDSDLFRPTYDTITTRKDIRKMKVGEAIRKDTNLCIKEIDVENKYVLLYDKSGRQKHRHLYIENIDTKPSIYGDGYRDSSHDSYNDDYNF